MSLKTHLVSPLTTIVANFMLFMTWNRLKNIKKLYSERKAKNMKKLFKKVEKKLLQFLLLNKGGHILGMDFIKNSFFLFLFMWSRTAPYTFMSTSKIPSQQDIFILPSYCFTLLLMGLVGVVACSCW